MFCASPISRSLACCLFLAATTAYAQILPAQPELNSVIFVDADANGANDGSSWSDAFVDLQDALSAARNDPNVAEIWVAEGVYHPAPPSGSRGDSFVLVDGVGLFGGFAGWEALREQRNWTANITVLSGDLNENDTPSFGHDDENSYHVVKANRVGEDTILDGFVITRGHANSGSSDRYGAGIYIYRASPMVRNCAVKTNRALGYGAGVYSDGGNPILMDCQVAGNWANYSGGGVYAAYGEALLTRCAFRYNYSYWSGGGMAVGHSGNAILEDCDFISNSADEFAGGLYVGGVSTSLSGCGFHGNVADIGGGIYSPRYGGNLTELRNCTFSHNAGGVHVVNKSPAYTGCVFEGNLSSADGGGAYHLDGDPVFYQCAFIGNSTLGNGGGAYTEGGAPVFDFCDFEANAASQGGGGVYGDECVTQIVNCGFSDNSASNGGGVNDHFGDITLANCIFSGNTADKGGAVWNSHSLSMVNCLIAGNSAMSGWGAGGGLYTQLTTDPGQSFVANCTIVANRALYGYGGGLFAGNLNETFVNNIFRGNMGLYGIDESAQLHRTTDLVDIDYCDIQGLSGAFGGEGNIDADPVFAAPGYWFDNGTPYDYFDDIWIDGDYRLTAGSPCADAGDNTAVPADLDDLDSDGNIDERVPLDLRGAFRFVDDPLASDVGVADPPEYPEIVDMGAYEYGSCVGDLDGDGEVGLADLVVLLAHYGAANAGYGYGDVDRDGQVELSDLAALLAVYGEICQ